MDDTRCNSRRKDATRVLANSLSLSFVLAGIVLWAGIRPAQAQFVENFDSGSATFTTNDPYWVDHSRVNGFITQTTNDPTIFGGAFGNSIPVDASGTGFFLFDGTGSYPDPIPTGNDEFYISPTFSVTPNTVYAVRFSMTSANGINSALVQPEIGGSLLGSAVSPVGTFGSNGWQQFTFLWNSGSNSSASLILHNYVNTSFGNDMGYDNISVTAVTAPEPGSIAFLTVAGMGLLRLRRK
jgi:hypothetical protein